VRSTRPLLIELLCFLLLVVTKMSWAQSQSIPPIPEEPSDTQLVDEDVNIATGFYVRDYAVGGSRTVNYRTARQIVNVLHNEFENTVVETLPAPLFYWFDRDGTGRFSMWIEAQGTGCICDVRPYADSSLTVAPRVP